jgi:hypothetical protein
VGDQTFAERRLRYLLRPPFYSGNPAYRDIPMKLPYKRAALFAVVVVLYFFLTDRTPNGTECQKSASPDGLYTAERCLLMWVPGGNSEYVGRVFDAKRGKKLAQHTFSTPDPEISWHSYTDVYVSFSIGDGGDDATYISLPPSRWERFLAARPRL